MPVYGYTRTSTAEQTATMALQHRKIRAVAELSDLILEPIIEETGISGSIPFAERPAGGVLSAKLVSADVLIVAKLDRAFRNAADALARRLEHDGLGCAIYGSRSLVESSDLTRGQKQYGKIYSHADASTHTLHTSDC